LPTATFAKLPPDKRARFTEAALEEFAEHSYDQASVSRIVARLGISKGSVYQYFADKRELFAWLVEQAGARKLAAVCPAAADAGGDLFARLRGMYLQGLLFAAAEPRWARIGLRALEPSVDPEVAWSRQQHLAAARDFLREQLQRGVDDGDLRADLDVHVVAELVSGLLSEGLLRAFLRRANADDPLDPAVARLGSDEALQVIDAALDLLRRGLA
jgi:AcrR family transcriptional regulator